MGIGVSLILIAVGAILAFAVHVTTTVRGRVRNQRAVRKKRIISRLAFGPLPSV